MACMVFEEGERMKDECDKLIEELQEDVITKDLMIALANYCGVARTSENFNTLIHEIDKIRKCCIKYQMKAQTITFANEFLSIKIDILTGGKK